MSSERLQSAHFNQTINFIFKAQYHKSQFKYGKLFCYPNKFKSTRYEFYSRAQVVEIHTVCGCPCLVALDFQNQKQSVSQNVSASVIYGVSPFHCQD